MINVKYNTFATAILWENINNDTLTLQVKCYNGISVRLRILSIIVQTIPQEWQSLVQLLGMGLTPSFLVIAIRIVNTHFWHHYWELTPPGGNVKKCQYLYDCVDDMSFEGTQEQQFEKETQQFDMEDQWTPPFRPGVAGLLIGIECSRVRDSSWHVPYHFCNYPIVLQQDSNYTWLGLFM